MTNDQLEIELHSPSSLIAANVRNPMIGLLIFTERKHLFDRNRNDFNFIERFIEWICFRLRNLLDEIHSFGHSSEDGVFIIQPRSWNNRDEELRAIRVRSCIGHGQCVGTIMFRLRMKFIGEIFTPNGLSTGSIAHWITFGIDEIDRDRKNEERDLFTP